MYSHASYYIIYTVIHFTEMQVFWVSDGGYSVHMMSITDIECPVGENDKNESKQKAVQISGLANQFHD